MPHNTTIATVGLAVLMAASTAPPAGAQGDTFYACYVPQVGAIYLIKLAGLPTSCVSTSHIPISWTDSIRDGSITTEKLADGGVTLPKLSFDPATQAELDGHVASGDHDGRYFTKAELSSPGTINATGNPVDWTNLKNVPEGFADGTDDGSGGITDHGALSGLADDDHPQYALASGVRTGSTGFAVAGSLVGAGSPPIEGPGVRIMFWPAQAAFRVGQVGTQWDASSIGQISVAMGDQTTASGLTSTAMGSGSMASGTESTAMGSLTVASGFYSTAMGRQTTANGEASTAMGDGATASGWAATAMGDATASGSYSTAMGRAATASGEASIAMGNNLTASGEASIAMGDNTTASGTYSTAMGSNASTNGFVGSFVYGDNSTSGIATASGANQFLVRAAGGIRLRTNSTLSTGCDLPAGSGSWTCASSRGIKTDFEALDGEDVLRRVAKLPVLKWSYETERGVRHVGTFAEDFHAAFGLGASSTSIGMIDIDGVNLAAVQALEHRTRELREALSARDREIAALRDRLAYLEDALRRR